MIGLYLCRVPEDFTLPDDFPLTDYRREKLAAPLREPVRREQMGAELMLYHALREWAPALPWPPVLACSPGGKPFLPGGELCFSLSHSGGWAACAVGRQELGLDIQVLHNPTPRLVERCFREEEQAYIQAMPDRADAFTALWCRKESRLKAGGQGLTAGLSGCPVLAKPSEFAEGRIENLRYAVCVPGSSAVSLCLHRVELSSGKE